MDMARVFENSLQNIVMRLNYHKRYLQKSADCTAHIIVPLSVTVVALLLKACSEVADMLEIETYKLFIESEEQK